MKSPKNNSSYDILELSFRKALTRFHASWTEIVRERDLNPTLLPGWLEINANTFCDSSEIKTLIIAREGHLYAVLPYFNRIRRFLTMKVCATELLTNNISYHVALPSLIPQREVLDSFQKISSRWHLLKLANIPADSDCEKAILVYAQMNNFRLEKLETESSPFLSISGDWNSFLSTKNKKFRYKVRQRDKLIENNESLDLNRFDNEADTDRLADELLQVDARSWKAKYQLDIGSSDIESSYYRQLLPYLVELGALHADVLYFKSRPIAYSLCCNWNGWFGQLKTSFDETFAEFSPGSIVIQASVRSAHEAQAEEFDFLGDRDKHKSLWTDKYRLHHDYFLYSNAIRSNFMFLTKYAKRMLRPVRRNANVKPS